MKILMVGLGSMGKRRIRILKQLIATAEIVGVDTDTDRREEAEQLYQVKTLPDLEEALSDGGFDAAFVSTSPLMHAPIIEKCLDHNVHVFTELNLTEQGYDGIISKAAQNNLKVFISSTMLYDKQICAIQKEVEKVNCPLNYIYHVGQYLPDWHPWESYKNYFVSRKETNACREIFAIQLPWIVETFGKIKNISTLSRKSTGLEIDYEDTVFLQIEHENGTFGVFVCDVVSRRSVVSLEIIGEQLHLIWDGSPQGLKSYDLDKKEMRTLQSYDKFEHVDGYADTIIEDEYVDEIKSFLAWLTEDIPPKYMLEDDRYILSLIDQIEGKGL